MAAPPDDFAALIARAQAGDPTALAELVRRYESRVRLVARVLLGKALQPYLDSMDLVQSVHRSLLGGPRSPHGGVHGGQGVSAPGVAAHCRG
jgi:RNA polymerase sigma-70 factor (ECF subfamily)